MMMMINWPSQPTINQASHITQLFICYWTGWTLLLYESILFFLIWEWVSNKSQLFASAMLNLRLGRELYLPISPSLWKTNTKCSSCAAYLLTDTAVVELEQSIALWVLMTRGGCWRLWKTVLRTMRKKPWLSCVVSSRRIPTIYGKMRLKSTGC